MVLSEAMAAMYIWEKRASMVVLQIRWGSQDSVSVLKYWGEILFSIL